ncbi:MAG: carboxypeptidase-like regulatory domain-containing protein [Butyricimonas faecihominis]
MKTGEAIPLSTLMVKELGWGSVCDTEGKFKIDVPANRKATLTVRSVGMRLVKLMWLLERSLGLLLS